MNKRLIWTTTALLTTALGMPSVSHATQQQMTRQAYPVSALQGSSTKAVRKSQTNNITKPDLQPSIARVQPHEINGRMAATVVVRNVPVLTFVGSTSASAPISNSEQYQQLNEPVMRATNLAAQINHLSLNHVDANLIKAVWEPTSTAVKSQSQSGRYVIKVQDQDLVEINSLTRLPDTISNPAKDALQATNRLRALLGNAAPLGEISGQKVSLPEDRVLARVSYSPAGISFGIGNFNVLYSYAGLASWYSFQDNGHETASGEPYNEMDLTAAHKKLPFGTRVQVTNLRNNQSVVVRITDRGPYIAGREIDLSTAAAGAIGMIEHGVVPVQMDILGKGN